MFKRSRPILFKNQWKLNLEKILKIDSRFVNHIWKVCFYFWVHSLATFNLMIALFQNHPVMKLLYGDFCSAFAEIPSVSRLAGMGWKSCYLFITKHNFYKEITLNLPSRNCPIPYFILSCFPCKQHLISG